MNKKMLVQAIGVVFLLIGLIGFVNDPILGLFDVNTLHNVIHLVSGVLAFVFLSRGEDGASNYGKFMTVVYGLVTIMGLTMNGPDHMVLGLIPINGADNVLHILLTALFVYVGFVPNRNEKVQPA